MEPMPGDNLDDASSLIDQSSVSPLQDSCEVQTDPDTSELENAINSGNQTDNFHVQLDHGTVSASEIVVVQEDVPNGIVTLCNNPKPPIMLPVQTTGESPEEPLTKRICLEQGGQTFVLALQDGTQGLPSSPIDPTAALISSQNLLAGGGAQSSSDDVSQAWFTSREDKTFFQNKGHLWRQGMWSKDEVELLENNIRQYCEEHDITDPATIIFAMSKDGRKDFYRTVAKGLNRPLFSVYRRVIRMYDDKNHVGKYTPEELEKLKKLRSVYGNDWQAIGAALGRSASSIKDRCRLMKENCNQGKWLQAEERRLAEAVYELANAIPGEMISSGLSWAAVAERVATRSERQCRTKWLNYLNWKEAGGTEWTREDDITLIYRVCSLHVNDENCIDWNEMAKNWASVRSPQWLRGKWWSLKRHVPDNATMPFPDLCEYLFQHYAQKIKFKEEQAALAARSADTASPEPSEPLESTQSQTYSRQAPTVVHNVRTTPIPVTPVTPIVTAPLSVPSILTTAVPSPIVTAPHAVSIATPVTAAHLGVSPMLQALEVLPQGIQLTPTSAPQTFLLTHPTQPAIPLAATVSPNQIIIQAVSADAIANNENVTVQMNAPPHIIISAGGHLTSLTPDQLSATALTTEHLHSAHDDSDVVVGATMPLTQSPMIGGENNYESQVMREAEDMGNVSEIDEPVGSIGGEQISDEVKEAATHLILSDPMLSGDAASELIGSPDVEADKTPSADDPLDSVTGDEV